MLTAVFTTVATVAAVSILRDNHKIINGLWLLPARTPEQQELRNLSTIYRVLHSAIFTLGVFLPFFFKDIRVIVVFFLTMILSQKWALKSSEIEGILRHDSAISLSPQLRLTPIE